MRRLLGLLTAVLLIGGCGDDSSSDEQPSKSDHAQTGTTATIQGCAPQCLPPNFTEPGSVPKGTYNPENFFAGQMSVDFENGWAVGEDSTGEFRPRRTRTRTCGSSSGKTCFRRGTSRDCSGWRECPGPPMASSAGCARIRTFPSPHQARAPSVRTFPQPWLMSGWPVRRTTTIRTARRSRVRTSLDSLSGERPTASRGNGVTRFYFSDVKYGGKTHLFVAAVEGVDKAQLDAGLPGAERLIEGVIGPSRSGLKCGCAFA